MKYKFALLLMASTVIGAFAYSIASLHREFHDLFLEFNDTHGYPEYT